MSVIASLKNIDKSKYAIVRILDAIGIDIDMSDGHLYYPEDPAISIDINDKILRVDLGHPDKHIDYSSYNPLLRVDHAQFLMTLLLHAQIMDEFIEEADALEADFSIQQDTNITDEDGNYNDIPTTTITIVDKDEEEHGSATHVDPAIATCLAIIDYGVKVKWIAKNDEASLVQDILNAYDDHVRLNDMPTSARRNEMKTRKGYMIAPKLTDDSQIETDFEGVVEDKSSDDEDEDLCIEDDPEDTNMSFDDKDFEEDESEKSTSFSDEDFTESNNDVDFITFLESGGNDTSDECEDTSQSVSEPENSECDNSTESDELGDVLGMVTQHNFIQDEKPTPEINMNQPASTIIPMMPNMPNPYEMNIGMMPQIPQQPQQFGMNPLPVMNQYGYTPGMPEVQIGCIDKYDKGGMIPGALTDPQTVKQDAAMLSEIQSIFPNEINKEYSHFNTATVNAQPSYEGDIISI